jgi:hypothetical protein
VEVARSSDTVLLAVRAIAPDLAELPMDPPMRNTARFGLVTLRQRSEAPALKILRALMGDLMGECPHSAATDSSENESSPANRK